MTFKTYEINVDLVNDTSTTSAIRFSQNDKNSAKLLLTITNKGAELDLSQAKAVRITFEKSDGKIVFQQDCEAINAMKGKYQIVLKTQTLAVLGNVYGQVQILEGDKKIDSQLFVFTVKRSLSSNEAVESTNEFTIIQKAIEAGEKLEGVDIQAIVESKETAEQAKTAAVQNATQIGILSENVATAKVEATTARTEKIPATRLNDSDIPSSKLKTSTDADKLKLIHLSDEVKQAMAGTTPINASVANFGVTKEKVAFEALDDSKLDFGVIPVVKSKNLYRTDKLINDKWVMFSDGKIYSNTSYTVTDFLPVLPSTNYCLRVTDQIAFYTADKVYIKGHDGGTPNPITSPANAAYIRISTLKAKTSTQQLNLGDTLIPYEVPQNELELPIPKIPVIPYSKVSGLSADISALQTNVVNNVFLLSQLSEVITNPFKRCNIKLVGDSITEGWGATTGNSWASLFSNYITTTYNKTFDIAVTDKNLKYDISKWNVTPNDSYSFGSAIWRSTSTPGENIEFNFYGTSFSIMYAGVAEGGILDIFVDGTKVSELDTYAATTQYMKRFDVTGLSATNHRVLITQTSRRNASSTGTSLFIEGLKIPKTATVTNKGFAGRDTKWIFENIDAKTILDTADDIILYQLGTNDRGVSSVAKPKFYIQKFLESVKSRSSAKTLIMCAPPATSVDEGGRPLKMKDIHNLLYVTARENQLPLVSHYNKWIEYIDLKDITLKSMLDDELHPNDAGYKVMFNFILSQLNLPKKAY
ncbi:BppU family phage baseplate upper protein [Bacillus sp. C30]|uniref:BppU family phage baseplate upper protein n=1 Tax=Bacillus sp. C30 TaxID=1387733 RepID=UPI00349FA0D1